MYVEVYYNRAPQEKSLKNSEAHPNRNVPRFSMRLPYCVRRCHCRCSPSCYLSGRARGTTTAAQGLWCSFERYVRDKHVLLSLSGSGDDPYV